MTTISRAAAAGDLEFDCNTLVDDAVNTNHDNGDDVQQKATLQAFKNTPLLLKWDEDDTDSIQISLIHGWKSLLFPARRTNIRLNDDGDNHLSVIIEILPSITVVGLLLPCWSKMFNGSVVAHGFFFSRDTTTGHVNLIHRMKFFSGTEATRAYRDIQCFNVGTKRILSKGAMVERNVFLLTTGFQSKCLQVEANFKQPTFRGFSTVIDRVNDFIMNGDDASGRSTSNGVCCPVLTVDDGGEIAKPTDSNIDDSMVRDGSELGMCTFVDTDMVHIQKHSLNDFVGDRSSRNSDVDDGDGGTDNSRSNRFCDKSGFKVNQAPDSDQVVEAVPVNQVVVVQATLIN